MATISPQPSDPLFSGIIFHPGDESSAIVVPPTAATWQGFREWAHSEEFPERGNLSYANGEIHIDMSPERIDTHNLIKVEISAVLRALIKAGKLGYLFADRASLSHAAAKLTTEPDGMFVSRDTLASGKAMFGSRGADPRNSTEVVGSPDWVLEIVSPSSLKKDNIILRKSYFAAGVREYWIVDALGEEIDFQILIPSDEEFVSVTPQEGWLNSPVFGKKFWLKRSVDFDGFLEYTLHMQ